MLTASLRSRYILLIPTLFFVAITVLLLRLPVSDLKERFHIKHDAPDPSPEGPQPLKYKPELKDIPPPLPEYFPAAAAAKGPEDLPPVPSWNRPPAEHVPENTRLYLGFTRYWPLLQQVVVSYITAGWPPEDIYVVENTGTFDANKRGQLTSQNPFYMDHDRLTRLLGVNVITMPSLQSFAQLQNFYLSQSIADNLTHYFWGHMDIAVLSREEEEPYKSLYMKAVDVVREVSAPDYMKNDDGTQDRWAIQFFAYDWLAMVNVQSFRDVGAWDSMVGYYGTDCDMHSRLAMMDFKSPIQNAGEVFDVTESVPDLEVFYRQKPRKAANEEDKSSEGSSTNERRDSDDTDPEEGASTSSSSPSAAASSSAPTPIPSSTADTPPTTSSSSPSFEEDTRNSTTYHTLFSTLKAIMQKKQSDIERNSWQHRQKGGQGEPFYYDPEGFEQALQWTIETGAKINEEKWGHKGCDLKKFRQIGDMWRVEHDETFKEG